MSRTRSSQLDMTQGSITKVLFLFAVPFLIGNLFQELYTFADSLIVGHYCNASALAAIGSAENPSKILLNIFMGFSTATTILVSQYFGAKDSENMKKVTATSNGFMMMAAVPLIVLGVLLSEPILKLIRVEEGETMGYAMDYLRILMIGTPTMLGYNQNAGILRGLGDSRSPLYFLVIACVANIALDFLFVGPLGMQVAGAAWATILAQGIAWISSVWYIRKKYPELEFKVLTLRLEKKHLKEIMRIGVPLGLNNSVFSLGHTLVAGVINGYGTNAMAGYTCAKRLDTFCMLPMLSCGNAITTYVGQNAGAGKTDRVKKGILVGTLWCFGINIIQCAIMILCRDFLLGLFNDDPEVIASGSSYLVKACLFYWIYVFYHSLNSAMNGAKEVAIPTISSLVMFWAVRIPLMFYFDKMGSLEWIYWSFPISWVVGIAITGIYFMTGKWKRHMNLY